MTQPALSRTRIAGNGKDLGQAVLKLLERADQIRKLPLPPAKGRQAQFAAGTIRGRCPDMRQGQNLDRSRNPFELVPPPRLRFAPRPRQCSASLRQANTA